MLGFASGFSLPASAFWALMIFTQVGYLNSTYLRQVYLVKQMELMSSMEEVRITTVLHERNSFSFLGKSSADTQVVAPISDLSFSEKDNPNSAIMRIIVGSKRYYMHKNMSKVQDFELLKAVLSPQVERIEAFK